MNQKKILDDDMERVQEKEEKIRNDYKITQFEGKSDLDRQLKQDGKYYGNMIALVEQLGRYAIEQKGKGNIGPISRYIIQNTGATGKMFQVVKLHLFGEQHDDIDEIYYQHDLRK